MDAYSQARSSRARQPAAEYGLYKQHSDVSGISDMRGESIHLRQRTATNVLAKDTSYDDLNRSAVDGSFADDRMEQRSRQYSSADFYKDRNASVYSRNSAYSRQQTHQ